MRYLPLILMVILGHILARTQDLYTPEATKQFADYLFSKGDYDFASEEYARLFFMQPQNDTILVRLSQSLRKQGNYSLATDIFRQHRLPSLGNSWVEQEYLATLLFQKDEVHFKEGLAVTRHTSDENLLRSQVEFALLKRNWQTAAGLLLLSDPSYTWTDTYNQRLQEAQAFRAKKPWLAATYSAIVPGSGKVYAKNVKEGITSFFFVAAMAYQSYRAFNRRGLESVTGWIYGGLGLGFYLGNIYGAHQSARNYNQRRLDAIYHEVDQLIYSRY